MHSWSVHSTLDPLAISKTQGVYMWDENGKRYLDMTSQLMNQNIGHQHPKVVEAIRNQAAKVCFISPDLAYESRSFLGKALAEVTPKEDELREGLKVIDQVLEYADTAAG